MRKFNMKKFWARKKKLVMRECEEILDTKEILLMRECEETLDVRKFLDTRNFGYERKYFNMRKLELLYMKNFRT